MKPQYVSYNAMARSPMVAGIPFMPFLMIGCLSMLVSTFGGLWFGLTGWMFGLPGVPALLYIKSISSTDDKAIEILLIEMKWFLIKKMGGNAQFFNGAMHISPVAYGRKGKEIKRFFDANRAGQSSSMKMR